MSFCKTNIEDLIKACQQQNRSAQLQVYKLYYKAMYNTALRILKNSSDAEDIMQDSFVTAFAKLNQLQNAETFGAWLKRIVINNCMGHLRKHKKITVVDFTNEHIQDFAEEDVDTEVLVTNKKMVLKALQQLKANYTSILSLHFIEGYDYEEIGEIMQINQGNVRTLMSRAKISLQNKMKEMYG